MPDGFINVLKPPGMTSHDVVSFIRRVYKMKKVGHAGTLDPAAAGVLPVALGKATRLIEYMADADKEYRTEMTLGFTTDSGDDTGNILKQSDFTMPSEAEINLTFKKFLGKITQIPPIYSAIKINGQRACDLARQNIEVSIPQREIEIHRMALLKQNESSILFDVECSKGTYIRTLCMDMGQCLGIPAVMSFLVRLRVGSFCLANSVTLDEIKAMPEEAICSMEEVLEHLPLAILTDVQAKAFQQGQKIAFSPWNDSIHAIKVYQDKQFVGIARYDENHRCLVPVKVIA
jgi:tRNA pseudouridine55 synthase